MTTSRIANDESAFELNDAQYRLLENERALHHSDESESYTREEARQLIKNIL
jgi:hypothetical protein